jgi:hypothetical protein
MTLNYEDCHHLYSLPNIITVLKSGRMRWEGHRTCMRDQTWHTFWSENLKDTDQFEDVCKWHNIQINIKYRVGQCRMGHLVQTGIKGGLLWTW